MKSRYRCLVLSILKHDYIPRGVLSHPEFELVAVADQADIPAWAHTRNQEFADEFGLPYVQSVSQAIREFDVDVAIISSEAERHCELSMLAVDAGLHVVQDKPMSTQLSECERLASAVSEAGVTFLMWNRNFLPAVLHARELVEQGAIGTPHAIHVDFYFAKDCGPPKCSQDSQRETPPIDWLEHQLAAHADGSDGGLGSVPMGELKNEGIYPLGYISMLTQAKVRSVFARTTAHFHQLHVDNQVEDLATLSLNMERGIVGTISLGRIGAASHPDLGEIKIHMIGSTGSLVVAEARPEVAVHYRDQPPQEYPHHRLAEENSFLLLDDFAQAIKTQQPTILDANASLEIAITIEAALKSAKTNQVVTLESVRSVS